MKIAIVSTIVPNVLRTGSEIATFALVRLLEALGHDVTVYAYGRNFLAVQAAVPSVLLATIPITTAETSARDKLRWALRSARSGLPISSEKFNYVPAAEIAAAILAAKADLLIADHINLYPFVCHLADRLPLGVVFHDIQATSYAMVADNAVRPWWKAIYRREARLNAVLEAEAGRAAAFSWFLSAADADLARDRFDNRRGRVVPLFYPFEDVPQPTVAKLYDVGLIGTWSWPPVAQGMRWFLDHVVPHIPPNLTVAVAGSGTETLRSDRILRLGSVPDARAFLASCRVAAVPSVAGTGIQIKTLELAATGVPAVSTPLGVRGLDPLPKNVRVAEGPADFAAALEALIHDGRGDASGWPAESRQWNAARRTAALQVVEASLAEVTRGAVARGIAGLNPAAAGHGYRTNPGADGGAGATSREARARRKPAAE